MTTISNLPPVRRFRWTKIKRTTLELLAEYFCLRTKDIAQFLYGSTTTINIISVNRTLRSLLREGYLNRIPYLDCNLTRGGITFAYGLSDKGVEHVVEDLPFFALVAKTFDEHSQRTLDHELEISFFHAALKQFCHANGFELYWQQKGLKKKTVAPDTYFAITDPKLPGGANTLHYFLEIERSKIGNVKNGEPSIIRKLGKYYDYFNSDECEKEWEHFRQFRVIVVQRNDHRRQHLLRALEASYAHRMFWLTSEALYKQDLGARIFLTPRDHETETHSFQGAFL